MAQSSSGVSGVGIAAIFAGGILVWSGVKGTAVSGVVRDLISGKSPSGLKQTTPVSAGGLFSPILSALNPVNLLSATGGGGGPGSATVIGTGQGQAFARSVLATIGAPQTPANIQSIMGWIQREGGGGANNPLNTTLSMPGATDFNSVGVKNYSSISVGILATAKTLLGGGYSDVVSALKSGQGLCGRSWSGLSTWSGGGYSSVC
jgi:hypothetical protein